MKLDPRIIEGRKPLTCFDAEEAEKFVGQKGYVSDDISTFTDLDFCESGKLEHVVKENGNGICYPYTGYIMLGGIRWAFDELLQDYEFLWHGTWQPFGMVKEK